jgi:hypothetical protein
MVPIDFPGRWESASTLLIQRDSRLVIVGTNGNNNNYDFVLDRYIADFTLQATLSNITCPGEANGVITVFASGGVPPYEYSLDGINYQTAYVFAGLAAGSYTVTIRDSNGAGVTGSIGPIQVLDAPDPPHVHVETTGNTITIHVEGNPAGYLFSINNGIFQTSNVFADLADGVYVITVQDNAGCIILTMPVTINTTSVSNGLSSLHFDLSPNPGDGRFKLKLPDANLLSLELEVMDISGRIVYATKIEGNNSAEANLDLRALNTGSYLVRVFDGAKSGVKKVVMLR